jgi:hypothetical protein
MVTYKGIVSELSLAIRVGDTADPVITFGTNDKGEDIETELFKKYILNKWGTAEFKFHTQDLIVNPNGGTLTPLGTDGAFADWYVARNLTVNVTTPSGKSLYFSTSADTSDNIYLHGTPLDQIYLGKLDEDGNWVKDTSVASDIQDREIWFTLNESGEYSFQLSINSESGQPAYFSRTITVETPATKAPIAPQTIWGTVLIVISAGLFIGVVVYFIQTGRKTKFTGGVTTQVATAATGDNTAKKFLDKFKGEKKESAKPNTKTVKPSDKNPTGGDETK